MYVYIYMCTFTCIVLYSLDHWTLLFISYHKGLVQNRDLLALYVGSQHAKWMIPILGIWKFPKIGVPPNHAFLSNFPL